MKPLTKKYWSALVSTALAIGICYMLLDAYSLFNGLVGVEILVEVPMVAGLAISTWFVR